jgi:RNA polymerase sigma factor (sigma-70 family)
MVCVFPYMLSPLPMKAEDQTLKTSWTLVARLKNVDSHEHWQKFYDLYRGLILGVAMKAGLQEDEAKDVLQATMTEVSKNIGRFEADPTRGSFHAWLLQMARWRIANQFKKRMPIAAASKSASDATDTTPTVERIPDGKEVNLEELCDAEWRRHLLDQALKEIQIEFKAEHYQVFHLLTIEQKPIAEVAQMLGKNLAQIYLIKHRVTNALKASLRKLEKKLG